MAWITLSCFWSLCCVWAAPAQPGAEAHPCIPFPRGWQPEGTAWALPGTLSWCCTWNKTNQMINLKPLIFSDSVLIHILWLCYFLNPCMSLWPVAAKPLSSDFPSGYRQFHDGQTSWRWAWRPSLYPVSATGHSWVPQDCSAPFSEAPWPVSVGCGSRAGTLHFSDYLMSDDKLPKAIRVPRAAVSLSEGAGEGWNLQRRWAGGCSTLHPRSLCGKKHRLNLCMPPSPAEPEIGNSPCLSGFLQHLIDLCC